MNGRNVEIGNAHGFGIARGRVLHVHGHVVYQPVLDKRAQTFGVAAVGVELHLESPIANFLAEFGQPGLQKRLAAGDADAVEELLSLVEKCEELVSRVGGEGSVR